MGKIKTQDYTGNVKFQKPVQDFVPYSFRRIRRRAKRREKDGGFAIPAQLRNFWLPHWAPRTLNQVGGEKDWQIYERKVIRTNLHGNAAF